MTLFARFYKTTPPETVENANFPFSIFTLDFLYDPPVYPQTQTWSFAFFLIRWRRVVDVAKRMCPMSKCRTSLSLPNKESECVGVIQMAVPHLPVQACYHTWFFTVHDHCNIFRGQPFDECTFRLSRDADHFSFRLILQPGPDVHSGPFPVRFRPTSHRCSPLSSADPPLN